MALVKEFEELATQEKIREGIAIHLYNFEMSGRQEGWIMWLDLPEEMKALYRGSADMLAHRLDKMGVVIKVKREFPEGLWMPEGSVVVNANGAWLRDVAVKAIMDLATIPLKEAQAE